LTGAIIVLACSVGKAAEDAPVGGLKPDVLWQGLVPITNSMLTSWLALLLLLIGAIWTTRRLCPVPGRAQGMMEVVVGGLASALGEIMGPDLARRTFSLLGALFFSILLVNWFGLLPGIGSIGWGQAGAQGFHVSRPLLRGGNADIHLPLAMSASFFACWLYWSIRALGIWGFIKHLFGPKGNTTGIFRVVMIVVFLAVGMLEMVSILIRPLSLSLRLFGNIYAGETLLEAMLHKVPALAWLLPLPFYLMEALVGLIQATVFTLLTAVFIMLSCQHDEDSSEQAHSQPQGETP
jgi:F-type H+-transporting ATPase subunit a